ncbi:MAG: 3-hydroxyacyl-CoA dehydrogenase family protein [Chitinophagaceae bacterium]
MHVTILCSNEQKAELLAQGARQEAAVTWIQSLPELEAITEAQVFVDLLFEHTPERMALLTKLLPAVVIVNSVGAALAELNPQFVRINGWTTLLSSPLLEAAGDEVKRPATEEVFSFFNKAVEWLPDSEGFITPRVICAVINEAYFALEAGISSREDIDTAMKLGTAYPYGPLDWGNRIGLPRVASLLKRLSGHQPRYIPCALLLQEANAAEMQ